eukprot:UN32343
MATDMETLYYLLQLGWYGHRAFSTLFEYQRSDYWEMFIHHCVASTLIILSYASGWHQLGSMV